MIHPINPTHVVSFYGLTCFWNDETNELAAFRSWLDWLVPVLGQLHCAFSWACGVDRPFPLRIVWRLR